MKLALLDTCPYYTLKPSAGKRISHTEFGGRFIELAGNEDFALTVELIVEMFLDRINLTKVAPIFGILTERNSSMKPPKLPRFVCSAEIHIPT